MLGIMTKILTMTSALSVIASILLAVTVFFSSDFFRRTAETTSDFHRHETLDDARVAAHDVRITTLEKHIETIDRKLDVLTEVNRKLDYLVQSKR